MKDYIHTASTILNQDADADNTIDALKRYLKRRGHSKFYPSILKGIQRELLTDAARNTTKVTVAREADLKKFETEISTILTEHNLSPSYNIVIDPTIIGGYIVRGMQTKIDHSYKMTLFEKYQSLKNHI